MEKKCKSQIRARSPVASPAKSSLNLLSREVSPSHKVGTKRKGTGQSRGEENLTAPGCNLSALSASVLRYQGF